ncbi:MAG: formylglycine-generating enzyme family protein [Lewinellaceae bacterium]|nr:formylglycine-generating enzyme family protein [Lewinellaceae bacterium]
MESFLAARAASEAMEARKDASPQNGQVIRDIPLGPAMVFVEGGSFQMGSNRHDSESPIHSVTVPSFWMGRYPITFDEYDAYCTQIGKEKPTDEGLGRGRKPVINVTWEDAQEYCKWLSEKTGQQYRLPTEAEWEFAAMGGTISKGFNFAGSNDLNEVGWYDVNSGSKTQPVGEKKPNELGLHDMSGNVWEWCADAWHDNYIGAPADSLAWEENKGTPRVLRGGAWDTNFFNCRVSRRNYYHPNYRINDYGFRIAHDN